MGAEVRIGVVTEHYWPEVGGAEVMLRRLAEQWADFGCQVTILTRHWLPETPAVETDGRIEVQRLPLLKVRFLGTLQFVFQLRGWLSQHRRDVDVVYVSMLKHAAWACTRYGSRWQIPIVLRAEGAGATGDVQWQQTALGGRRIAKVCKRAPAVVAPAAVVKEELLAAGYDADRIDWIPNGVPVPSRAWTADQTSARRRSLGIPDRSTLCYVGRLHPMKGVQDLIAALAEMTADQRPQLLVVGDGPAFDDLNRMVQNWNLTGDVRFQGQVADVEPWLRASELFVLPSYQEGLSVSLLEAAILGMPLLAGDIPANQGILDDDFLPLTPIRQPKMLAKSILRQLERLAAGGIDLDRQRRQAIARFSIAAVAKQHLELFDRCRASVTRSASST